MSFGSNNAPTIFSRVVVATINEFIHKFSEVYFDDWKVYGLFKNHIESFRLMLENCRLYLISLHLKKCIFCAPFDILLGHVICKQGLWADLANIAIIVDFLHQHQFKS